MVEGLDRFARHFRGMESQYVIIGGTACDLWLGKEGFGFRETKDIDMVLVVEALDSDFIRRFLEFISIGKYMAFRRDAGRPKFYRFEKPKASGFPKMIELLTRNYLKVPEGIHLTPIPADNETPSLSAILLDEEYYRFVVESRVFINDIPILPPKCLIPLKARAHLDLRKRKESGDGKVKGSDVKKHRNDVFRLYLSLKPEDRFDLPGKLGKDLDEFLAIFTPKNPDWAEIRKSVGALSAPEPVIRNLKEIFKL